MYRESDRQKETHKHTVRQTYTRPTKTNAYTETDRHRHWHGRIQADRHT